MRIVVEGADLDVADDGHGEAIVFLHGFGLSKRIWDAQAETLALQARAVRIDLRGMGHSSAPGGPYLTETLAGDVMGVLDALDIGTALVVGHSYSVGIALEFYRMFAERVSGLALLTGLASAPDAASAEQRRVRADAIERDGMAAVAEQTSRYVGLTTRRQRPDVANFVRELILATSPAGAVATYRGLALRGDADDLLPEIGVPVAVVAGTEDEMLAVSDVRAMADMFPTAFFETLPTGHVPSLEAPESTTAILQRLIERMPSFAVTADE